MSKLIRKLVKKSDPALFYGLHLLSSKKRKAFYTLVAFEKHIIDIVQSNTSINEKMKLLDAWNVELNDIYTQSQPSSRLGINILKSCAKFPLVQEDFACALEIARQELTGSSNIFSIADYNHYCDLTTGAFLRQSLRILGCHDQQLIKNLSECLGQAIQTTIILSNMRNDAYAGKVYIPQQILKQADINSQKPSEIIVDNNLSKARCELGKIAQSNYIKAFELINCLDKKTLFRLRSFAYIYKYCFDAMEKRGWEVISPKPQVKMSTKLRLILRSYLEK